MAIRKQHLNGDALTATLRFMAEAALGISSTERAILTLDKYAEELKLTCDVKLPGIMLKKGVRLSTLLLALERRRGWEGEDVKLDDTHVWVAHRETFDPIADLKDRETAEEK